MLSDILLDDFAFRNLFKYNAQLIMMDKKVCLGIITLIGIILICGCIQKNVQSERVQLSNELNLSDFPETFSKNTYLVVGDEASQHETNIAEKVLSYIEKNTGQKLEIKESSAINKKDRNEYNFILIGQTDQTAIYHSSDHNEMMDNKMINDLYKTYNTKSVRTLEIKGLNSYWQGTKKGYISLFKNLWSNNNKYILVIGGFDEKGLDFAVNVLLNHTYIKSVDDIGLIVNANGESIQSSSYLAKRVASSTASGYGAGVCSGHGDRSAKLLSETEDSYIYDYGCGTIDINKNTGEIK